jgi:hypothetical protein
MDGAAEIWRRRGGATVIESVAPVGIEDGAFVGEDEVVILTTTRVALWLHRGPAAELPDLGAPAVPAGFTRLRETLDGTQVVFEGEDGSIVSRRPGAIAAFSSDEPSVEVTIHRTDAAELSAFGGAAWGDAVAARYLEPGHERWAFTWTDEGGRVFRGHTYIGGCERTHIDVLVRERGAVLERWIAYSPRGRIGSAHPATPHDAAAVAVTADSWGGETSTGPAEP